MRKDYNEFKKTWAKIESDIKKALIYLKKNLKYLFKNNTKILLKNLLIFNLYNNKFINLIINLNKENII